VESWWVERAYFLGKSPAPRALAESARLTAIYLFTYLVLTPARPTPARRNPQPLY
jgi:hypothetical protein